MIIHADVDRYIKQVIQENEYDFLFKDLVVIDVGCNIGTFSLWLYDLASEIHAIDISKQNILNLEATLADNLLTKIRTHRLAIAGKTEVRTYIEDGEAGMGGWRLGKGECKIAAMTLNDFMKQEKIERCDVLKIDVEGEEREILRATDFPRDKVATIIGEMHSDGHGGKIDVESVLKGLGYWYKELPNNHFIARRI